MHSFELEQDAPFGFPGFWQMLELPQTNPAAQSALLWHSFAGISTALSDWHSPTNTNSVNNTQINMVVFGF